MTYPYTITTGTDISLWDNKRDQAWLENHASTSCTFFSSPFFDQSGFFCKIKNN